MKKYFLIIISIIILVKPSYSDSAQNKFINQLINSAIERTNYNICYDGSYFKIKYPNGDIPSNKGVCTDVVIRSYRSLNIDLQKLVHLDIKNNLHLYPINMWNQTKPDTNIDHRRVKNLMVFFKRHGESLPITNNASDYKPGDIITWNIGWIKEIPHIGIVINQKSKDKKRYLIVHNIGMGPKINDVLFAYKITGHYRYIPKKNSKLKK